MVGRAEIVDIRNESLQSLEPLLGRWHIEVSNAEFLDSDAKLTGQMTVTWLDGQALLVLRSVIEGGPPASVQMVGRNEDRDEFTLLYSDERGVSRVYAMTFVDGEWTQSRTDPNFHQRLVGRMSNDGNRIEAAWSKSHDEGATWQHDFDVTYSKTSPQTS